MKLEPSQKPLNLLLKKTNNEVKIKLKNNVEYLGKMIDCDSHMNIILEGAKEMREDSPSVNLGSVIVRGSNILYVCVSPEQTV